jgi:hypothetical protein
MLYEKAERAGYSRYVLVPKRETSLGNPIDKESVTRAREQIEAGVDLATLDAETVGDLLDGFEQGHGHKDSMCFDVFEDDENEMTEAFILRDLRESHIREVDGVVFGDEAELIVLRLYDRMWSLEEHSSTGVGIRVASAMASLLLDGAKVHYIGDRELTEQENLRALIDALLGDTDSLLRLRELYLEHAPIEDSPVLILRCEKSRSLSTPLEFFKARDIDLLSDLENVRSLKISFAVPSGENEDSNDLYSFTVYCESAGSKKYFVPYAVSNIPTRVRSQFEAYLRREYDVRVVPGTA